MDNSRMLLNFCNAPECITLYVWVLLCGLCVLLNGLPHPSQCVNPKVKLSIHILWHMEHMTIITVG